MDSLSGMLEARARNPGCQRLKTLHSYLDWLSLGPMESRIRLLRLLLPSIRWVSYFCWNAAFEPTFLETRPVYFELLQLSLVGGGSGPSAEVLEAMPALKSLLSLFLGAIPPVITALHRGIGLKNLGELVFMGCYLGGGIFADLLDALEASGCAKQAKAFVFSSCNVGIEGARSLADCLRRNVFPALDRIRLAADGDVGDEGVVALAKALVEAPRTLLTSLDLSSVGMCDVSMAALASAVQEGRFERLERLELSDDSGITDEGIITLAQAIDARGLPALETFSMVRLSDKVTILGTSAITHALVKSSPDLTFIRMRRHGPKDNTLLTVIKGMLRAARRTATVIDV